ncbi:MAG: hypothetical protein CL681_29435 [Blastopirellula sp.]|nr:hypothetical protein [Blastopirellula sp.]
MRSAGWGRLSWRSNQREVTDESNRPLSGAGNGVGCCERERGRKAVCPVCGLDLQWPVVELSKPAGSYVDSGSEPVGDTLVEATSTAI